MIAEVCKCRNCGRRYLPVYDDSVVKTGLCFSCYLDIEEGDDDCEEVQEV